MNQSILHNNFNPIDKSNFNHIVLLILVILYLNIHTVSYLSAQSKKPNLNWTQFVKTEESGKKKLSIEENNYYICSGVGVSSYDKLTLNFEIIRVLDTGVYILKAINEPNLESKQFKNLSIQEANNLWKFNSVLEGIMNDKKLSSSSRYIVYIQLHHASLRDQAFLQQYKLTQVNGSIYKGQLSKNNISKIIEHPTVIYVGLESNTIHTEAIVLDLNLHPNRINTLHHYFPQYRGQGELVSIQEPTYQQDDIDLIGRYSSFGVEGEFSDYHATEMATIVAGAGNSFVTGAGVAPKARHTSADNTDVIPQENAYYLSNHIFIQNHSYGTEIENFYGALAYSYDNSCAQVPTILHVQSAGNAGESSSIVGKYAGIAGYANLTGNFKQAKNVLTIGSVDTTGSPVFFSSAGPAFDGRVKPELVTYSTAGTSNSAALISGTAILLQQAFQELYKEHMPSTLTKALLINSADEAGTDGIDFKTGFGQLNAIAAMESIQEGQFVSGISKQGEIWNKEISIPAEAINFKATLVWLDPPANINDEVALKNDLDFEISTAGGGLYLPEVLNHFPHIDSLSMPAKKGKDHLNTIEQIQISNPKAGKLNLKVIPYALVAAEQEFYIVYQYDLKNSFQWTSPTGSDNIPYNGETISHLRWESSFSETTFAKLSYKNLMQDSHWKLLSDQINLSTENYRWEQPSIEGSALLKMEIGSQSFISDTFTISTPINISVAYNCADSLLLRWTKSPYATAYQIKQLMQGELVSLTSTPDTSLVLYKEDLKSNFFQVSPLLNRKPLIQSFTIDYNLQGAACYLNGLFSYVEQDSGIFIIADIGYPSNLSSVILEKEIDSNWTVNQTIDQLTDILKFRDESPENGNNNYRIRLIFTNGIEITSTETSAYFVKDPAFIVYPNPISVEEDLKIFGKSVKSLHTFELFSSSGNKLMKYYFNNDRAYVELPETLTEGLYHYQIFTKDGTLSIGKILIKD